LWRDFPPFNMEGETHRGKKGSANPIIFINYLYIYIQIICTTEENQRFAKKTKWICLGRCLTTGFDVEFRESWEGTQQWLLVLLRKHSP
jgi:hypothetical protein